MSVLLKLKYKRWQQLTRVGVLPSKSSTLEEYHKSHAFPHKNLKQVENPDGISCFSVSMIFKKSKTGRIRNARGKKNAEKEKKFKVMQRSFAYGDRRLGNAWNGESVRRNGKMVIVCIRRKMCWFSNMASIGRNKYGEDVLSDWNVRTGTFSHVWAAPVIMWPTF